MYGSINIVLEILLGKVSRIDYRLCRKERRCFYKLRFFIRKAVGACGMTCFKMSLESFKEFNLSGLVLIAFKRLLSAVDTAFNHLYIGEDKFKVDSFDVTLRINAAVNMDNVSALKAAYNVNDSVNLADICKELVTEALAL